MLYGILTICLITCLSDLTPGPNFWKIVHHAVAGSRQQAVIFILGLSAASTLHCVLGMLGVSALIASFEAGLMLIQIFGGGYIAWYGVRMLMTRKKTEAPVQPIHQSPASSLTQPEASADVVPAGPALPISKLSTKRIFIDGVLTNFANPKTILFYASLFALTLTPDQPAAYVAAVMVSLLVTSLLTNLFVGSVFSLGRVSRFFKRWEQAICRTIGGMLVLGGLKIAFQPRG